MAIQEHQNFFPKHMRWACRCQFLLLTFFFQLVHSTNSMGFAMCDRGAMIRTRRILVLNERCLCISSLQTLPSISHSLITHVLFSNPLLLQNLVLRFSLALPVLTHDEWQCGLCHPLFYLGQDVSSLLHAAIGRRNSTFHRCFTVP